MKDPYDTLLQAARELVAARYTDGEVDAVAMHRFAAVVEQLDIEQLREHHHNHRLILQNVGPPFAERRGCLDCDVWLEPVRFIDRPG